VTRVKVCGITRAEDARLAAALGATALGFIFWPGSPRYIDPARVRTIVSQLPPFLTTVGVFVNQPVDHVVSVARLARVSAIQLHGDEPSQDYVALGYRVIKAVPIRAAEDRAAARAVPASATVLLDAYDPERRGGTGQTVDWSIAASIARERPIVLSGGLTPENVPDALRAVEPYAVDVSSGVEDAPGVKSAGRLRSFFAAVERMDRS
jgi:phosphoribosylanthranilate isomerase